MSLRNSRRSRRAEAALDLTALIDVVFLLLIFFLVTSTLSKTEEAEIPINLPSASSGEQAAEGQKIVLFITEDGSVDLRNDGEGDQAQIDETRAALEGKNLREKLDYLHAQNPDSNVVLQGDKLATHGKVIEVLDELKKSGFQSVNLVITRPQSP